MNIQRIRPHGSGNMMDHGARQPLDFGSSSKPDALDRSRDRPINLSSVDLNLLVALESLLKLCNVTHAADAVGLSQPAMSRALSRLRGMFNDELLVRTSTGYVRTVRGEQLNERLPVMLEGVRDLIASRSLSVDEWRPLLRVAMADHQAFLLLPNVLASLEDAPIRSEILVEPLLPQLLKKLETGELDMAVGQISGRPNGFFQRTLYADDHACLLRADHPALAEDWSDRVFQSLCHAVIAPDAERFGMSDASPELPVSNCTTVSPNIMGTALSVVESDMVLTVPRRVATKLASLLPLRMLDLPIELPRYEVVLLWHERSHRDPEHVRVRAAIADAAASAVSPGMGKIEAQGGGTPDGAAGGALE